MDDELKEKYDEYISELEEKTKQFNKLLNKAFDPDFRNILISSVDLAKEAGIEEDKILDSMEKIDDYFS